MNPYKREQFINTEQNQQGDTMSLDNLEKVDQLVVDAIGDTGILVSDTDPNESKKVAFTEQDESIFFPALGKFMTEHKKLDQLIEQGLISPQDSIAEETRLLAEYKKEIKTMGQS